jgi:hypothetical protein
MGEKVWDKEQSEGRPGVGLKTGLQKKKKKKKKLKNKE